MLTLLVAVTLAFRGAVVGTLLGNVVTVQVRGVDYVAVAATVILGVLAVADALLALDNVIAPVLPYRTGLRRESEMTVIIATHDPQIASRCDRLIRLRDGAVIDDIEISGGYPVDETIRRVGQLG